MSQFIKAFGWIGAIWLVVSGAAMVSRLSVALQALAFVRSDRYRPLLEHTRSGRRCIGTHFLGTYLSLLIVNIALFWLCFQNFFPSAWRIPLMREMAMTMIVLLGVFSVRQTASIMMMSATVAAHLAEHDPDADSW